jgi:hypothetical protein
VQGVRQIEAIIRRESRDARLAVVHCYGHIKCKALARCFLFEASRSTNDLCEGQTRTIKAGDFRTIKFHIHIVYTERKQACGEVLDGVHIGITEGHGRASLALNDVLDTQRDARPTR